MPAVGVTADLAWDIRNRVGLEQSIEWDVDDPSEPDTSSPCYDDGRCGPFERIEVDFLVAGATRVTWRLRESFTAPEPYTFQLQVGDTANPLADDWTDAGASVEDTFTAVDEAPRAVGKQLVTHYRIKLTDADDQVYYSLPATVLGRLSHRDWGHVREISRQFLLQLRQGPGGIRGFLLKRKRKGTQCTRCVDPETKDVLDSKCPVCLGTRFTQGYYRALPCQYADPSPAELEEELTDDKPGWSMSTASWGRFLGTPQLVTGDLWVDASSDLRYHVGQVKRENIIRGVPVTQMVRLEQLPFDNIAYTIPLLGV